MTKSAILEEFHLSEPMLNPSLAGPTNDWQQGHLAGVKEGLAVAQDQATQLSSDLIQRLQDMSFGYSEAKAEMLKQLAPLFEALSNVFLPEISKEVLIPRICETLLEQAEHCLDAPMTLAVSKSQFTPVSEALADQHALPFSARPDPTLSDGQAIISSGAHELMVDLDGLLEDIRKTLGNLVPLNSEGRSHG